MGKPNCFAMHQHRRAAQLFVVLMIGTALGTQLPTATDLRRAMTSRPTSSALIGRTFADTAHKLNAALRGGGLTLHPCADFTAEELVALGDTLMEARSPTLDAIFTAKADKRQISSSLIDQWKTEAPEPHPASRDGKCHTLIMLWVHHLDESAKNELVHILTLPALPSEEHFSHRDSAASREVIQRYREATTCKVAHGDPDPVRPAEQPQPGTPQWPPVMAPVWPPQWTASVEGWSTNPVHSPHASNVTGFWHYDFTNNRYRADFKAKSTGSWLPLTTNLTFFWFGDPRPAGEPAPTNGWEAGHFYVVVRPAPLIEICTKISYPGLSILRPDSYEQLRLAHTVVYVGRELVDNRWSDRWTYNFTFPPDPKCGFTNFSIWTDIHDHTPVTDYRPNGCDGGLGVSHWSNFTFGMPDPGLFETQKFGSCKNGTSEEIAQYTSVLGSMLHGHVLQSMH